MGPRENGGGYSRTGCATVPWSLRTSPASHAVLILFPSALAGFQRRKAGSHLAFASWLSPWSCLYSSRLNGDPEKEGKDSKRSSASLVKRISPAVGADVAGLIRERKTSRPASPEGASRGRDAEEE